MKTSLNDIFINNLPELELVKNGMVNSLEEIQTILNKIVNGSISWKSPTRDYYNEYFQKVYTICDILTEDIQAIYSYLEKIPKNSNTNEQNIIQDFWNIFK